MSMDEEKDCDYDGYFRYCGTYFCMGLVSYLPAQYPERNEPPDRAYAGVFTGNFHGPVFH